ncbi:MAG: type III-B CRISPR module RAMP protein Cmr4 [Thermotoga sp.]|nr:MAG: type III-B CRISPR module RAMP protein Cmr4 [Thermotoga sp.]
MWETKKIYAKSLDPIHIGAGGYRLGRVDNTIVRDPSTDVPKIPGTSIAGVVKAFAEIAKKKGEKETDKKFKDINIEEVFGTKTKKGILRFYDGQIILFPVSSMQGTVWITTKDLIEYWFGEIKDENGEKIKIPDEIGNEAYAIKGIDTDKPLNLGWLLLKAEKIGASKEVVLPSEIKNWVKRIVIVSDKLFSNIVNDNLEIRTSVRIDPTTGTAAEGALFTYEAIPEGTILGFEICLDRATNEDDVPDNAMTIIMNAVKPYLKNLGIGGAGTRGFGRIEITISE